MCVVTFAPGYSVRAQMALTRTSSHRSRVTFQQVSRDAKWHGRCSFRRSTLMTDREAKSRAVKILAKSIYRDLEAQGFDEKQIVALATELISEVTSKIATVRTSQPEIRVA